MISTMTWVITIAVLVLVLLFDLILAILRRNKETTLLETGLWTVFYQRCSRIRLPSAWMDK